MPSISIGVPVYNGETFLAQALDSLLCQSFQDFEVVICDNASKDNTPNICEAYARKDRRIKHVRSATVIPPAANHNRAFELSSGQYFKWAAHDDLCAPTFLEGCLNALKSDPLAVLAYPRAQVIDGKGELVHNYTYKLPTDVAQPHQRFGALVRANHRLHGAFEIYGLVKSEALRSIPPMGNYPRGDSLVLARLSLIGKFCEVPEVLFFSRDHGTRSVRALPTRIESGRTRLHRYIGTGPMPPLEWWDPSKKGTIDFPEWKIAKEYVASALSAPVSSGEKTKSLFQIGRWLAGGWPKLCRDLVIASEQLVMGKPQLS